MPRIRSITSRRRRPRAMRRGAPSGWMGRPISRRTWRGSGTSAWRRCCPRNTTSPSRWTMDTERAVVPGVQPLVRELPSSWKPLRVLAAVERLPHTVFLESAGEEHESCEWTILAFDPAWRLELRDGALRRIQRGDGGVELPAVTLPGHPLDALAAAWPARVEFGAADEGDGASIPFVSGLAGYLSYDLKDWIERYPSRAVRESPVPDLSLGYYDVVWAWQRSSGKAWVVATGLPEPDP